MTHPRLRLGVATVLFLGWIGYLAYLVVRTRDPIVLSRPQLLHSDLVLVLEVSEQDGGPSPIAVVKETAWAGAGISAPAVGSRLRLPALGDVGRLQGWRGKGEYLIPLQMGKNKEDLEITGLPWSPGFSPRLQVEVLGIDKITPPVQKWLAEKTIISKEDLGNADPKQPFVVKRNLDRVAAIDMQAELEAAGARVQARPGEYRIYFATPDAREQLKQIKGN